MATDPTLHRLRLVKPERDEVTRSRDRVLEGRLSWVRLRWNLRVYKPRAVKLLVFPDANEDDVCHPTAPGNCVLDWDALRPIGTGLAVVILPVG